MIGRAQLVKFLGIVAVLELFVFNEVLFAQSRQLKDMATSTVTDFKVNDDLGNNKQQSPSIDTDNSGNFVICWSDARNPNPGIYGQRFYWNGQFVGSNFLVNDIQGATHWRDPVIGMDGQGNFVIAWKDDRAGKMDLYAQRYDKYGNALGINFRVNDIQRPDNKILHHAIGMDKITGNFIIAWTEEDPNGYDFIHAQKYYADGTPAGSNFTASNISTITKDLSFGCDDNGTFYLAYLWVDNTEQEIMVRRFSFGELSDKFKVTVGDPRNMFSCPNIAVYPNGNFIITWEQQSTEYSNWDIYAQRFLADGSGIGTYFEVSEDYSNDQTQPAVSIDHNDNVIITWMDKRNGNWDIYAQKYDNNGQAIGNNYLVDSDISFADQTNPDVSLISGRIYYTWFDTRESATNGDVYAKIEDWKFSRITVISPNGGEVWHVNSSYTIIWQATNNSGNVKIEFSRDNGATWSILTPGTANDGYWDWTPQPEHISSNCLIEVGSVENLSVKDVSDANFVITSPVSKTTYHAKRIPDGMALPTLDGVLDETCWTIAEKESLLYGDGFGQRWYDFTNNLVTWQSVWSDKSNKLYVAVNVIDDTRGTFDNNDPNVYPYKPWYDDSIEFYTDGNHDGGNYEGRYDTAQQWRVSGENNRNLNNYPSASHTDFYTGNDFVTAITTNPFNGNWTCEAEFIIYDNYPSQLKTLTIGDIIGWEMWYADSDDQNWLGSYYGYDNFTGWLFIGDASANADYFGDLILDGDLPHLVVSHPNGNEKWQVGAPQTITWTFSGISGNVKIEISTDAGFSWSVISSSTFNNGKFTWIPTKNYISNSCLIKITSIKNPSVFDQSDSLFQIVSSKYRIKGRLFYFSNNAAPIKDANVQITGSTNQTVVSAINGGYEFSNLEPGNYVVAPQKNNDIRNAISAYDASIILRYSVELQSLSPYQKIASDVTGNGEITSYDASYVLRYCVGLITTFPVGADWTFVPHTFPISDVNWSTSPRSQTYAPLNSDAVGQDFVGILYGDVSGNWAISGAAQSNAIAEFQIWNFQRTNDGDWSVLFTVKILGEAYSGDFYLKNSSPDYQFGPLLQEDAGKNELLVASSKDKTELRVAFASAHSLENKLLKFKVFLKASKPGATAQPHFEFSGMKIDDQPAITTLVYRQSSETSTRWQLSQNYPNPFNSATLVEYQLPKRSRVVIEILNLLGARIQTLVDEDMAPGTYQVRWDARDTRGNPVRSGIYLLKMQAGQFTKMRKMIVIR